MHPIHGWEHTLEAQGYTVHTRGESPSKTIWLTPGTPPLWRIFTRDDANKCVLNGSQPLSQGNARGGGWRVIPLA
jgi:hypothetical protein